jgi:hypothetical protein
MLAEVLLSEPIAAEHVTNRVVTLTINGIDQPTIDAMSATPIWPCNENDQLVAKVRDKNSAGDTESDPYSATAVLPQQPPTKPSVLGFTFSSGQ